MQVKRLLIAFLICFIPTLTSAKDFIPKKSIQMLIATVDKDYCTAFSINSVDGYWATAAHCILNVDEKKKTITPRAKLQLHGKPCNPAFIDPGQDIAVVQCEYKTDAIPLGEHPSVLDNVTLYGYLWAEDPSVFLGKIANLNLHGKIAFDLRAGPGMSGAPVLDASGHVVSIAQWIADGGFSGGCLYEALEELMPYWE